MNTQVVNFSSCPAARLEKMATLAQQFAHVQGAFVECGVYNGGGAAIMAAELGPRDVWLFDSFEGLPEPATIDGGKAVNKYKTITSTGKAWQVGDMAKVKQAFDLAGCWSDRVHLVKGWFEDTLAPSETGAIAVLHLDADWYASTKLALETLYDRVVPGGLILLDDYGHWVGCRTAVIEFWREKRIAPVFTMLDETAGYWVKDGPMIWRGTPDDILDAFAKQHPELPIVLARSRAEVKSPKIKREIGPYQAAALYALTKPFDAPGARILEIGTAMGYSASVLAQAAPQAHITTLNPRADEADRARLHLATFPNVEVVTAFSWDYLATYDGPPFDVIFVDGDHAQVVRDMPWFNHLKLGGLMIHHDYSPAGSWRACPPVFACLNQTCHVLGRGFDVLVVDDQEVGMAGWYRREGETLK